MDQASKTVVDNFEATMEGLKAQQAAAIVDAEAKLAATLAAAEKEAAAPAAVVSEPVPTGLTPSKNIIVHRGK
jgi:hypothetical protein